ncbi:phosphate signaling complex protein PhoU [Naumannella halotolerans]|uniref:Phosphate-specific transport system accessory protein PhoU n=1 Tax=Naumannella halotolerans TaxID=993414 RepID=A0A4R7IZ96_9ACTN|nr:phosphate signaling complex protein PhoU [Naumannella halotolerans]TDT30034.1 phosphate transport system protein [Naumannella halotolerans]
MRDSYREQLESVVDDMVRLSQLVSTATRNASQALLTADLQLAEQVISDDVQIDNLAAELEQRCFGLLALQAPVAGELRTVIVAVRLLADFTRMGDLAAHIAKIARLRYPDHAVPADLEPNFNRMSEVAVRMIGEASDALRNRDTGQARRMAERDEEMDDLRSSQFRLMLADDWQYGVEAAVDVALLGRYFERIADHAVTFGREVVYIVEGELSGDEVWS